MRFDFKDLAMPYSKLIPKNRALRIFNGRGSVAVRDLSVTGLQSLRFPPFCLEEYRFSIAFREHVTKALIQDIMPEMSDYMNRTGGPDGRGPHPLGTNWEGFVPDEEPGFDVDNYNHQLLLFRDGEWQPGRMYRIGNYHKKLGDRMISFLAETCVSVSHDRDECFFELKITNRSDEELILTILPVQKIEDLHSLNKYRNVERPEFYKIIYESDGKMYFNVSSDIEDRNNEGWQVCIRPGEKKTYYFSLSFGFEDLEVAAYDPSIRDRMAVAGQVLKRRLEDMFSRVPSVNTDNRLFDLYYKKCLQTVAECTWRRDDYILNPLYTCGTWMSTLAWDTSFSAKLLAMTDPEGLKSSIKCYIGADVLKRSYLYYRGGAAEKPYLQTLFAAVKIVEDYILMTGDRAVLEERLENGILLDSLKKAYLELFGKFLAEDGLLDFKEASGQIIEIRTDGYKYKVSGLNGIAAFYLLTVARWCRERGDKDAESLFKIAEDLAESMNKKMWDSEAGWFACLYPDKTAHMVYSYHLFDFIASPLLSEKQRAAMVSHIKDGEFLGDFGMYSIAKTDMLHFDYADADWGGAGQYIGMPNRIAEALYLTGYDCEAWDILSRCIKWSLGYPYFPQEIYTEKLDNPDYEMPLEISAGAGVQAVLFGVFGIRPKADGTLCICPSYNKDLGKASLDGFKFCGHIYDVVLSEDGFSVLKDGETAGFYKYGSTADF